MNWRPVKCLGFMGYLDAQAGDGARTAFRRAEKQYKLYKNIATSKSAGSRGAEVPPTDLSRVLDFREISQGELSEAAVQCGVRRLEGKSERPVYVLDSHPGFYFLPQAVSLEQQQELMHQALTTFPEPPNRTSHTAHYGPVSGLWVAACSKRMLVPDVPVDISDEFMLDANRVPQADHPAEKDEACQPRVHRSDTARDELFVRKFRFVDEREVKRDQKSVSAQSILRKLRWATLGIQFDWSKRAYDVSLPYRHFPKPLAELAAELAEPAMDGEAFHAEAAIVNFFGPDDMLGGHIDDMEANWQKPIVSISLGCKAIFLLGGETREDVPVAMFLRSGDAVLMKGPARRCFHGVPRIFVNDNEADLPSFDDVEAPVLSYIRDSRININIREVF